MQRFKSWDEIDAFYKGGLTPAEKKLKRAVKKSTTCNLGDLAAPPNWKDVDPSRHIRADVLLFLLTRSSDHDAVTSYGIDLEGALVSGRLRLSYSTVQGNAILERCRFQQPISADRTHFERSFRLRDSVIPSLSAMGATVDAQFSCQGTTFLEKKYVSIDLQRAVINGSIFLTNVTTYASVDLNGAKIGGSLECRKASFSSKNGAAFEAPNCIVSGGFFFRDIASLDGEVHLSGAHVNFLQDDAQSWDEAHDLALDGFTYDRISGSNSATDFQTRLKWLEKGDRFNDTFFPQPYTQLAKVLHEMGHERDAREIRVVLAEKLAIEHRKHLKKEHTPDPNRPPALGFGIAKFLLRARWGISWGVDFLFRSVVGYGFKPARSLYWLGGLIALAWFMALGAWETGQFTPNSAPILVSQDWIDIATDPHAAQKWSAVNAAGQDWETFNSFAYAADIVIPIIEIGQTSAWAPSPARGPWGGALWWMRWVFTAAGWTISALGAAAITGVIRRE